MASTHQPQGCFFFSASHGQIYAGISKALGSSILPYLFTYLLSLSRDLRALDACSKTPLPGAGGG